MLAILISILIIVSVIIIIIIIIIYHDALGDSCLEFIQGSADLADSHTFLNTHLVINHNSYSLLNASLFQALDMFCLSPPQNKPMRSALSHLPFYQWGL